MPRASCCNSSQQMMENLQMAPPDMNGDDNDDMMSALDDLGDMIRQQQDLRDRTFKQGQDQRQQGAQARPARQARPAAAARRPNGNSIGELRQNQQALRDRLNKLLDESEKPRSRPEPGWPARSGSRAGPGTRPRQGQGQGQRTRWTSSATPARRWARPQGNLGQGNADSAVELQGRALDALRKGAQGLAQSMQQQMGQGQAPGRSGRLGQSRAEQDTDPLGRPLRGRDYGDDSTVKVPGEIDVQRARRIIDELRKRFGDFARPQEELDYIERLLKDY